MGGPSWGSSGSTGAVGRGLRAVREGAASPGNTCPSRVCPGQSSLLGASSGQSGELRQTWPQKGGPRPPQPEPRMRDSVPLSGASLSCLLDRGFSSKPSRQRGCGFRVYQTSHLEDSGENRMVLLPAWTPRMEAPTASDAGHQCQDPFRMSLLHGGKRRDQETPGK